MRHSSFKIILSGFLIVLSGVGVRSQDPIAPSHHETVPRDSSFNPSGGGDLSEAQEKALNAAIKEFENYAKTHPDVAPELRAIQEVKDKERFKKGGAKLRRRMRTLPDRYKPCPTTPNPCWGYWEKKGGGDDDFPPRTILIGDQTIEGIDPRGTNRTCLRRALAIITLFREGGAMPSRWSY